MSPRAYSLMSPEIFTRSRESRRRHFRPSRHAYGHPTFRDYREICHQRLALSGVGKRVRRGLGGADLRGPPGPGPRGPRRRQTALVVSGALLVEWSIKQICLNTE